MAWKRIPVCERCWIEKKSTPTGIQIPVVVLDGEIERCGFCNAITIVGIYSREDIKDKPKPIRLAQLPNPVTSSELATAKRKANRAARILTELRNSNGD